MSTGAIRHFTPESTIKDYLIVARKSARGLEFEKVAQQLATLGKAK